MCINCSIDGKGSRRKFVIPINSLKRKDKKWWQFWKKSTPSRKIAEEALAEIMERYKEKVNLPENLLPINKNDN